MEKILLINADEPEEVRVVLVEDGRLEEVYVEAGSDPTGKGNIYVGRVQNVERGIGAAFVDLGGGVTGFLHASDIADPPAGSPTVSTGVRSGDRDRGRGRGRRRRGRGDGGPGAAGEPPTPVADATADPTGRPGGDAVPSDGPGVPPAASVDRDPEGAVAAPIGADLEVGDSTADEVGSAAAETEPREGPAAVEAPEGSASDAEEAEGAAEEAREPAPPPRGRTIMDLVKPGDDILVQISRGPVGHKGPTLTTRISLPGRYVVLLANSTRSGVSRRIETGEERDRMRQLRGDLEVPPGMAVILRTASNGRSLEEVQADLMYLYRLWENLKGRLLEGKGPRLVHEESDLVSRAVRDILPADATRIVTDDAATAERIREYLRRTHPTPPAAVATAADARNAPGQPEEQPDEALDAPPAPAERGPVTAATAAWRPPPVVDVHPGPTPLLHAFGVEAAIEDAFRRTIRLPSGGSIVIDPTEALVAIDVNSGRLTEEEDLETTALKTDLEAVPEVARQLRMRDLGGVIVIDFIDLRDSSHIHQVEQALREALKRDRARIRLGRMGPFGCLELTRQRIRPALLSVTHVACPTCQGAGRRRHPQGIALRVLRELRARAARSRGHGGLEVRVPPPIADLLRKRKGDSLAALEAWLTGPFRLVPDPQIPYGGWSIKGLPPRNPVPRVGPPGTPASETAGAGPEGAS